MKLTPKAKPVRIRILSGGEEHYSLESLHRNFVWNDVKQLFEGDRLDKWLRRIKEVKIADKLNSAPNSKEDILTTYNILFMGDNPFQTVDEVFNAYTEGAKELKPLIIEMINDFDVNRLIEFVNKYKEFVPEGFQSLLRKIDDLSDCKWVEAKACLYEAGVFLYDNGYEAEGRKCLEKSSELGDVKANEFLKSVKPRLTIREREDAVLNDSEVQKNIKFAVEHSGKIYIDGNGDQDKLYEFVNNCLDLILPPYSNTNNYLSLFSSHYDTNSSDCLFYREICFVMALLHPNKDEALNILKTIANDYGPAKAMIVSSSNAVFVNGGYFKLESNNLFYNLFEKRRMEYFLTHLKEFREYEYTGQ